MKVRATMRLRNEVMLRAREKKGLTQKQLASIVDSNVGTIGEIERFDYTYPHTLEVAARVAGALEIELNQVVDESLLGEALQSSFDRIVDIELAMIGSDTTSQKTIELNPLDLLSDKETSDRLFGSLSDLTSTEREVIKMRTGIGDAGRIPYTYEECGRIFKVTRERVRQVEAEGMRKLRNSDVLRGLDGDCPEPPRKRQRVIDVSHLTSERKKAKTPALR